MDIAIGTRESRRDVPTGKWDYLLIAVPLRVPVGRNEKETFSIYLRTGIFTKRKAPIVQNSGSGCIFKQYVTTF